MTNTGTFKKVCSLVAALTVGAFVSAGFSADTMAASNYEGGTVYNGHTYKAFQGGVDYISAAQMCESYGGHLITITGADIQALAESLLDGIGQDHCWIGLNDSASEGLFLWTDGTQAAYTRWGSGQPDNYNDQEDYVLMNCRDISYGEWSLSKGDWNDVNGYGDVDHSLEKIAFLCEWDTDLSIPTGFQDDAQYNVPAQNADEIISYEGHYYAVIDESLTWEQAKAACEARGGYLVCINSAREQQFLQTAIIRGQRPYYWIGLTDAAFEGNFTWVNGSPLTFTNWGEAQPDNWNDSEDAVMMPNRDRQYAEWSNSFGTWNDMNSMGDRDHSLSDMGYICEWEYIDPERAKVLSNLVDDLEASIQSQGLLVSSDRANGTITLDSTVLFDVDSYQVGAQGREDIGKLMNAFRNVFSNPEYQSHIASINIQGHTDSSGSYAHNVELSENRANAVRAVCMSALSDSPSEGALFQRLFTISGCASDYPVLGADGTEDKDASRRVVFVFYLSY